MAAPRSSRRTRHVVCTYQYLDERGRLVYQLARYNPKDFAWLRPDGRSWTSARRRRLLYRLPELLAAAPSKPVFVVEGEKDVDRLRSIGLVATCNDNGGGGGKWSWVHSRHLRGRSVVVLPDNDRTGAEHARDVACRLRRVAGNVRIVELPGLPRNGDVSDWLDAGGNAEKLLKVAMAASLWTEVPSYNPRRSEHDELALVYRLPHIITSRLAPIEKLLLIILENFGEHPPPQEHLAAWLGVSERRVRQLVANLQEQEVLKLRRLGRRNRYSIGSRW